MLHVPRCCVGSYRGVKQPKMNYNKGMSTIEFLPPTDPESEQFRVLTPEEVESLRPIFEANSAELPDMSVSTFVGCVKDGEIIGFIVLQIKLHAEPMWIKDGQSQIFSRLVNTAENVIITQCGPQWVYLFCPAGRVSQLASAAGMQAEPWVVFSKLVTHVSPAKPIIEFPISPPEEG
jgi:hypothetical protein